MTLGIVLDIDDTLYLERDYVRSGFHAISPIVSPDFGQVAWQLFEAGERGNIFNLALDKLHISCSPELVKRLVEAYRSHRPDIQLLPDASDFVERHRSKIAGFVTDGPLASQTAKASALGLPELGPVCFTESLGPGKGKPCVEGFLWVAAQRAFDAYVYVADNPLKDFQGPRELGWKVVRIRRQGGLHFETPFEGRLDAEIASFEDWPF